MSAAFFFTFLQHLVVVRDFPRKPIRYVHTCTCIWLFSLIHVFSMGVFTTAWCGVGVYPDMPNT